MRLWLLIGISGLSTMLALSIAGFEYLATAKVDPRLDEFKEIQTRHLDAFQEDQDYLRTVEILNPPKTGQADAGPFLNPRLTWAPPVAGTKSVAQPLVPANIREQLLRLRGDWLDHSSRFNKHKTDFSLFGQLERFDHWEIETYSPIAALIERKEFLPTPQLPTPETLDLVTFAKLRLLRALKDKDAPRALKDVRQLAHLLLTTENIHLYLSGLTLLDLERKAYRRYVDKGLIAPETWTPIDKNTTRRASRAVWATRGYLRFWTPHEVLNKVFLETKQPPAGFCAAVNEAVPKELMLEPLLAPHIPFERDYGAGFAKIHEIIGRAREHCRVKYVNMLVTEGVARGNFPVAKPLIWLPYSRKLFGLRFSSITFEGFDGYATQASHANY